jgi:hypothetical protein
VNDRSSTVYISRFLALARNDCVNWHSCRCLQNQITKELKMDTLILFGQIVASGFLLVSVPLYLFYAVVGELWRLHELALTRMFIAAAFLVAAYLT